MTTTYTNLLRLRLPQTGDTNWGDIVNDNYEVLEFLMGAILKSNVVVSGLDPSDGGGLDLDFAAGEVVVAGAQDSIASGSVALTASEQNWIYVDYAGTVQAATTLPNPLAVNGDFVVLAMVDTGVSSITRIADLRNMAEGALTIGVTHTPDNYEADTTETGAINQHLAGIDTQMGLMSGFKNLIINGNMHVAQRATSFTGLGNGDAQYTLDRWEFLESSSPTAEIDISRSTDHPNGKGYSLKIDTATAQTSFAAGDDMRVLQRIEAQNMTHLKYGQSDALSMVLSFWAKANQAGEYCVACWQQDGSRGLLSTYTITAADTWEKFAITIPGDPSGLMVNDNGEGFQVLFGLGGGTDRETATTDAWSATYYTRTPTAINFLGSTSNYLKLTDIQLEVGEVATPFERLPYSVSLALCKRYFQERYNTGAEDMEIYCGDITTGNDYLKFIGLPVRMRTEPDVNVTLASDSGFDNTSFALSGTPCKYGFRVVCTSNATTARGFYRFRWQAEAEI